MRKQSGITMVALVVTIIVLIVLAVVSINLALGQNGVLTRAEQAVSSNEKAKVIEEISLAVDEAQADFYAENATNAKYRRNVPYYASKTATGEIAYTTEFPDVFKNNCQNAETVIIDGENPIVADETGMVLSGGTNEGTITGVYKSNQSKMYYPFTISVSSGAVSVGSGSQDNNAILYGYVYNNEFYYIRRGGKLFHSGTTTPLAMGAESRFVEYDKAHEQLIASNVKCFLGNNYYLTFDGAAYDFSGKKIGDNVKWVDYRGSYVTNDNKLYDENGDLVSENVILYEPWLNYGGGQHDTFTYLTSDGTLYHKDRDDVQVIGTNVVELYKITGTFYNSAAERDNNHSNAGPFIYKDKDGKYRITYDGNREIEPEMLEEYSNAYYKFYYRDNYDEEEYASAWYEEKGKLYYYYIAPMPK